MRNNGVKMYFYLYQLEKPIDNLNLKSYHELNELENFKFDFIDLKLNKLDSKIDHYKFEGKCNLSGSVLVEKNLILNKEIMKVSRSISFNIRLGSGFVFIQTDRERKKIDAVNSLNIWLQNSDNQIMEFIPVRSKTTNLINKFGGLKYAKFYTESGIKNIESIFENIIHSNKCDEILKNKKNIPLDYQKSAAKSLNIVYDFDLNEKIKIQLLSSILMEYPLYKADFKVNLNNNNSISVSYYGDALKFSQSINQNELETIIQIFENTMNEKDFFHSADQNQKKISEKC